MSTFIVLCNAGTSDVVTDHYQGRDLLVYVPSTLPAPGTRALVVVLHGGLGNASRITGEEAETGLNMDQEAARYGFIVAYLNGTPVTRYFGADKLGWNAGGSCCGVPAANNVDDVGYITNTVNYLVEKYGINPRRVYGIGHSNGAMMTTRLLCETNLYTAGIAVSGPLNLDVASCPGARGKAILSIHGEQDKNVPIDGSQGSGLARIRFKSEEYTERIFIASGANYHLQLLPETSHALRAIDDKIKQTEGISLAEKATRFFGLAK